MAQVRTVVATSLVLLVFAVAGVWRLANSARGFNAELALADPPLAAVAPVIADPKTPRLARRVVLLVVDGLRLDHSRQPYFDELRARGASTVAAAEYPTISRASYATILTGAPPVAHGVRTNRLPPRVWLDSIMDRARAAKLRVVSASDIGQLASVFVRGEAGQRRESDGSDVVHPAHGQTWPFDDVRRAGSADALARSTASIMAGGGELVLILAGDVDRAGHAHGVGAEYAAAAANYDRVMRGALAGIDLSHDAIIVTADHGHVDRGGHGGLEPDVVAVPLILAGAGIVPGSAAYGARLTDIAPTIAALLGLPAPGHAHGRTLVELLQLERPEAGRRIAADHARIATLALATPAPPTKPEPLRLVLAIAGIAAAIGILKKLATVRAPRRWYASGVAFVAVIVALAVITRGSLSPSAVPALYRFERLVAISAVVAIALQLVIATRLLRRERPRLATANGFAICGLALSLVPVALLRAWFSAPHVSVPDQAWLVAIPGIELAGATGCAALALVLVVELIRSALVREVQASDDHGRPAAIPGEPPGRDR